MNRILIATDGSASSAEAVAYGVELAAEQQASVIFVHVAPALDVLPTVGFGMVGPVRVPHVPVPADRVELEPAEQVAALAGVPATSKLLCGNTVDEIVAYADSQDVDMIVIGSRGHGTIAGMLLGSVSHGVLVESKRTVVVIRAQAAIQPETPVAAG